MKKTYENPMLQVVSISKKDIIATSTFGLSTSNKIDAENIETYNGYGME